MADRAHLWVVAAEPVGVEAGPVRIEPATTERRVTSEAVALGMAGNAALQALARRLPMGENEAGVPVVEASAKRALGREPCLLVAVCAECARVMALGARGLTGVGGGGVPSEEARRVVTRC